MATDDTGAQKRSRAAQASPKANTDEDSTAGQGAAGGSADAKSVAAEIAEALTDAAHAAVGFGVISWNRSQVRRRELLKELNAQRHQMESQLDGAKEQLATAIRHLDSRIEPVRQDIDSQLDKFSERLPEQVRDIVESARKIARDTEHQLRQAVGAR